MQENFPQSDTPAQLWTIEASAGVEEGLVTTDSHVIAAVFIYQYRSR
jgi:hypothetical protein